MLTIGCFPRRVTFVGFPFKQRRIFLHYSVLATLIPLFTYDSAPLTAEALSDLSKRVGFTVTEPPMDIFSAKLDMHTFAQFQASKDGCSEVLLRKRLARNPFHLVHSYYETCKPLQPFFGDCYARHF
jgi:hypothetical protein